MKQYLSMIVFSVMMMGTTYSAEHTITNMNATFSPATLTISLGDTIVFDLADNHNAIEVSEATYLANSNTSNGGFEVPFGGGTLIPEVAGTLYYVCVPHASIGMKGVITVTGVTAIPEHHRPEMDLLISPNPATDHFLLTLTSERESIYSVYLSDITGATMPLLIDAELQTGLTKRTFEFDLPLSSGLYFVHVLADDRKYTRKLVIQ